MGIKVGIDLGTTFSAVAFVGPSGTPEIIENEWGEQITPSVVAYKDGEYIVGNEAKNMESCGMRDVFSAFKRYMGSTDQRYYIDDDELTAQNLSAILLKHMKKVAEEKIGDTIDEAVITCPAYFNEFQRRATLAAGHEAGLKVTGLINEPTAASVYYGFKNDADGKILTYDLGGGTFDVSILDISKGNISVCASRGDSFLGGKDWDQEILVLLSDAFQNDTGSTFENDDMFYARFMAEAETVKRKLTSTSSVKTPIIYDDQRSDVTITREEFDDATAHLVQRTLDICDETLSDMNMNWSDLRGILLIGGSTRMPSVRDALKNHSGIPVIIHEDTDLAVAKGAALLANASNGTVHLLRAKSGADKKEASIELKDVTSHALGTLVTNKERTRYINKIMIPRNTPIPAVGKRTVEIGKGNHTDKLDIYVIQGDEEDPVNPSNKIVNRAVAEEIRNDGNGVRIDIDYKYDINGMVNISAYQDGRSLRIVHGHVPEDISWMGEPPKDDEMELPSKRYVILAIDTSGSMGGFPMMEVHESLKEFMQTLENTEFAMVVFGTRTQKVCNFLSAENAMVYIPSIKAGMVGEGTNANPLRHEVRELVKEVISPTNEVFVVTLTDGEWYGEGKHPEKDVAELAEMGVKCIGIGFGVVSKSMILKLSSSEKSALTAKYNALKQTFSTIAAEIYGGGYKK